jgi:tetratricopeptide (TPR) repeat protein
MAAGAWGDALAYAGRGAEAVAVLEPTLDLARTIYGQDNFRAARALDWLSSAYLEAGRAGEALAAIQQAFAVGTRAAPGNPLTPVWLHRMVSLQLALHQPDAAAATLAEAAPALPERIPPAFRDALDVLELEVALRRDPADALLRERLAALVRRLGDDQSRFLDRARLLSVRVALANGESATAQALLPDLRPSATAPAPDRAGWLLLDALALRQRRDHQAAAEQAGIALGLLDASGRAGAPLAADLHAELAHSRCLLGDVAGARDHAAAATRIWSNQIGATALVPALASLSPLCSENPSASAEAR